MDESVPIASRQAAAPPAPCATQAMQYQVDLLAHEEEEAAQLVTANVVFSQDVAWAITSAGQRHELK